MTIEVKKDDRKHINDILKYTPTTFVEQDFDDMDNVEYNIQETFTNGRKDSY